MEFGDAEDDEHDAAARLAKRRKWSQAGGSTAKASSTEQPQKPVKHVPGQLAHADVVPTATATQVCASCACAVVCAACREGPLVLGLLHATCTVAIGRQQPVAGPTTLQASLLTDNIVM